MTGSAKRVLIVGGTGVFGSRLAELLIRDGCRVILAARRHGEAKRLADKLGAEALQLDRAQDLCPILLAKPAVVVDAAGPFQAYGSAPYQASSAVARALTSG